MGVDVDAAEELLLECDVGTNDNAGAKESSGYAGLDRGLQG